MTMKRIFLAVGIALQTCACAVTVPGMQRLGETPTQETYREIALVNHIKCELRKSLLDIQADEARNPNSGGYGTDWLKNWGTKITLTLTIDETGGIAPAVTYARPLQNIISTFAKGGNVTTGQSSSVALGANFSSHVTRTEIIGFYYKFADLLADGEIRGACEKDPEAPFMDGDLKIEDFMTSKLMISRVPTVIDRVTGKPPFSDFNYSVQFVVVSSGALTPAWKLATVSVNPTGPWLSGSRTRTNQMLLTLGVDKNGTTLSDEALAQHQASLIGAAVAQALNGQH